jgi:thiol-disulfide isomerase/thioredoxin
LLKRVLLAFCLAVLSASVVAGGFSLKDSKGKVHNLSDYKGKWVLVNFWATWCPPCLEEIPDLIALHEHKNSKVVVIGVAMDYQNPKQVLEFADGMFISYPIVLGNQKMAAQIGPVDGLPTTYLYNPQGKMVAQNVGAVTRAAIESFIAGK